jgi:hypothetical protein
MYGKPRMKLVQNGIDRYIFVKRKLFSPSLYTRNRDAATEEMRTKNTEKKLFCSVFSVFFFLWQKP